MFVPFKSKYLVYMLRVDTYEEERRQQNDRHARNVNANVDLQEDE